MQATNLTSRKIVAVSAVAAAAVVIAVSSLWAGSVGSDAAALPSMAAPAPMVGVATGEFVDGVAVYRLPAVAVTVSRSAELARMAQEERIALR